MIQEIVNWLEQIILTVGYPGVFLAVVLVESFAPLPSEALMPFIGYMAYHESLIYILLLL
jgi:membrane protein DedA with SNARE-associated domain